LQSALAEEHADDEDGGRSVKGIGGTGGWAACMGPREKMLSTQTLNEKLEMAESLRQSIKFPQI
jgi:hypothetical protein